MLVKGLRPDCSFESVEIDEQEEEILLKMIANYVVRNCVLEQTEDGHEIYLHYLPDWIFEGKMQ